MHQHGGQQHQQQRQCPAQHPLPVDPIAVLDRQPVAAQCLVLARCHLQQQAVEGRGQRGMAALHRHHQLIVETRRGSNLQAPLEAAAQQLIDQRQVAHIGIGFAIKNPLHRLHARAPDRTAARAFPAGPTGPAGQGCRRG
ncbi:hypothetical protein G6F59_015757 [Rhizopus arrhizus]|nr:hypothetical protein G6F59_015757 [Rhizopus arrhizus]